jgi:hypothetical protein
MVALKLHSFGGMIPAVDDRLLPQNQAALAQNAWVYTGAIQGFHTPVVVHTPTDPLTKKVFRIPKSFYDKAHIPDSYWIEFQNPDTDVVRSPTVEDQYERYYWASSQKYDALVPQYNTRARIAAGLPSLTLGIPAPLIAPSVSRASGAYTLSATGLNYSVTAGAAVLYRAYGYALDRDARLQGMVSTVAPQSSGATTAVSSTKGNVDKSPYPSYSTARANQYNQTGQRAELRYGTSVPNSSLRVTVSDSGVITIGTPAQPQGSTPPYVGQGVLEARAYVYTWVSAYGEEGPPSPATSQTAYSGDPWVIKITAPNSTITTNRNIATARIYRTVTSSAGVATYFFVDEIPVSQTIYTDVITDTVVSENDILQSAFWTPPPSDLEGMITMPNGIVAGWRGNEIWFCEPYRPHAWPVQYAVAVEYPVVGLGVIGQSLIACTTGYPHAITGINPATMAVSRIATYEPCLSRGSIVSSQEGVLYASPNGLIVALPGVVQNITRQLISKDRWQDYLYADTMRAAKLTNGYYVWGTIKPGCFLSSQSIFTITFTNGSPNISGVGLPSTAGDGFILATTGTLPSGFSPNTTYYILPGSTSTSVQVSATPGGAPITAASAGSGTHTIIYSTGFNSDDFLNIDYTGAFGGLYLDPHDQRVAFSELTNSSPMVNVWTDSWTGEMFFFRDSAVYWLDVSTQRTRSPYLWRSKVFETPNRRNMEALRIYYSEPDGNTTYTVPITVLVYADNRLVLTRPLTQSGDFVRLPSGFKATFWQVEVQGVVTVNSIEFATAAKELGSV